MGSSLILASASPRRRQLLGALGLDIRYEVPRVPEIRRPNESPPAFARRLAGEKAAVVYERTGGVLPVLAADTVVFLGEQILDKPVDEADAARTLEVLSGRSHKVVTGVAVYSSGSMHQQAVITSVRFRELTEAEIRWYVATGEPEDKAGAYAIQGIGNFLVASIEGSPSNVIGLPLAETLTLLASIGIHPPWSERTGAGEQGPTEEAL